MPQRQPLHRRKAYRLAIGLVCLLFTLPALDACAPKETQLSFETIEQHSGLAGYTTPRPGIRVVALPEEAPAVEVLLRPRPGAPIPSDQLHSLNYDEWFGLAVFYGEQMSVDYAIIIERITRRGNTVNVYARFQEPKPGQTIHPMNAMPYHLVRVKKEGKWNNVMTFNLIRGRTVAASVRHYVQ